MLLEFLKFSCLSLKFLTGTEKYFPQILENKMRNKNFLTNTFLNYKCMEEVPEYVVTLTHGSVQKIIILKCISLKLGRRNVQSDPLSQ
jgi:hypothetical protein